MIEPIVRYMIPCEGWGYDSDETNRFDVYGILTRINSNLDPPFPLLFPRICVVLILVEGRGSAEVWIRCIEEASGNPVFMTPRRRIEFDSDPLKIRGVTFRIDECPFPAPGIYSLQFWVNDKMVEERPLQLR